MLEEQMLKLWAKSIRLMSNQLNRKCLKRWCTVEIESPWIIMELYRLLLFLVTQDLSKWWYSRKLDTWMKWFKVQLELTIKSIIWECWIKWVHIKTSMARSILLRSIKPKDLACNTTTLKSLLQTLRLIMLLGARKHRIERCNRSKKAICRKHTASNMISTLLCSLACTHNLNWRAKRTRKVNRW